MPAAGSGSSPPRPKRRGWVLAGAGGFVLLLAFCYYALTLAFTESLYTGRGSFAYYLLIPEVIQDVPLVDVVGEVTFHSGAGDGPKPPSSSIEYRSRADEAALRAALETFLESRGFTKRGSPEQFQDTNTVFYGTGADEFSRPEISVSVSAREGDTRWLSVTQID